MNLKEIQNLIKFVAKSGATEVKLEMNDVKITIKTVDEQAKADTTYIQQMPALAPQVATVPVAAPQATSEPLMEGLPETEDANYITGEYTLLKNLILILVRIVLNSFKIFNLLVPIR